MATYVGVRTGQADTDGTRFDARVTVDGQPLRHLSLHSPSGFAWGYGGSGPSDLALSILLHHFDQPHPLRHPDGTHTPQDWESLSPAWDVHQSFKRRFVANWGDEWTITTEEIQAWLGEPEQRASLEAWCERRMT